MFLLESDILLLCKEIGDDDAWFQEVGLLVAVTYWRTERAFLRLLIVGSKDWLCLDFQQSNNPLIAVISSDKVMKISKLWKPGSNKFGVQNSIR
jgi:hypothetical protein